MCDAGNSTIRMVTPQGLVVTVAGNAEDYENIDGVGSAARFRAPGDLTVAGGGVIYITDSLNYTIRQITSIAPQIVGQPSSQTVVRGFSSGISVVLAASTSTPALYQWQISTGGTGVWTNLVDAGFYSGSATQVLGFSGITDALSGNRYRCIVSNAGGAVTSTAATLTVVGPPLVTSSSQTTGVAQGGNITLTASATGGPLTYQWYFNSVAIAGATNSSLTIGSFSAANAGSYTVKITNNYGTVTATVAVLSVGGGRLVNLSALSAVNPSTPLLTVGFILGGGGSKTLLLRGIGPSLSLFGYSNPLPDPQLKLFNASTLQLAYNAAWGATAGGTAALTAAFNLTFAFPLTAGSADDAILIGGLDATSGTRYSVQETSLSGASGAVLNEIYEADTASTPARLLNLSVIGAVAPGAPLIGGFVIGGTGSETVVIRGVGPSLANFNISNYLAHPVLSVYGPNSVFLVSNSAWGSNASTTAAQFNAAFNAVGAFGLIGGSSDAAVLLTLPAGSYSAQVASVDGTSGQALIEIYEVSQ